MFCAQPRTELSKFINAYKSARSRLLKKEYPEIRKKHREPAEGLRLRSVTVSMEPSGKYFASLLYEGYSCENQAAEPDYSTEKIRNQRRDHLHKLSRKIADSYDAVAVEDIDMKAMGQCLHFGKSVQDNGYGLFREMLDYKLAWQGKKMIKVDRFFPSSKKCCKCGRIKKELKLSERVYRCACGNEMDRDRNAAINIREEARRMLTA